MRKCSADGGHCGSIKSHSKRRGVEGSNLSSAAILHGQGEAILKGKLRNFLEQVGCLQPTHLAEHST